ncbi:hypothetical protein E7744_02440 [Citricoccus sp. SGAir0253]|uniref:hypothetical protein n=1 Tax=Citricoccus sp. SGAir0253 TaxID=2567881 RepID=UPI0010CD24A0|nr:hypothetical protein [Citricoccus sp. SGAir0253]QCU77201.1 hypothetical protein E7744_02440 [Citricoccus sp. SGAir0253]
MIPLLRSSLDAPAACPPAVATASAPSTSRAERALEAEAPAPGAVPAADSSGPSPTPRVTAPVGAADPATARRAGAVLAAAAEATGTPRRRSRGWLSRRGTAARRPRPVAPDPRDAEATHRIWRAAVVGGGPGLR